MLNRVTYYLFKTSLHTYVNVHIYIYFVYLQTYIMLYGRKNIQNGIKIQDISLISYVMYVDILKLYDCISRMLTLFLFDNLF